MTAHQQFQVELVQLVTSGFGFNVSNQHHRPLFSIVYSNRHEAEAARDAIAAALTNAIEVTNHP